MLIPSNHPGKTCTSDQSLCVYRNGATALSPGDQNANSGCYSTQAIRPDGSNQTRTKRSTLSWHTSIFAYWYAPLKTSLVIAPLPSLFVPLSSGSPKVAHTFHQKLENNYAQNSRNCNGPSPPGGRRVVNIIGDRNC